MTNQPKRIERQWITRRLFWGSLLVIFLSLVLLALSIGCGLLLDLILLGLRVQ